MALRFIQADVYEHEDTCTPRRAVRPHAQAFYSNENAVIPDYDALPEREVVRSDYDNVFEDSNWWTSGDESGANTFLTMPYFPFLSSCAGYGHHMSFAKLVESHPDCTLVSENVVSLLPSLVEFGPRPRWRPGKRTCNAGRI